MHVFNVKMLFKSFDKSRSLLVDVYITACYRLCLLAGGVSLSAGTTNYPFSIAIKSGLF